MKRFFYLTIIFFTFAGCDPHIPDVYGDIYGTVVSADTGVPLSEVSVKLVQTGSSVLTGDKGEYRFEELNSGFYTVLVQKSGYFEDRKTIEVIGGEEVSLSFAIKKINTDNI